MEDSNKQIDINLSNKSLDLAVEGAKGFLQSLVGPSVEELGLLWSDNIKLWRFKNQIKILNKAQSYIKEKGIPAKKISLKNLVPLLESSSLEEEESMQDKWSKLLANIATNPDLKSTIFRTILSEINSSEAHAIEIFAKESTEHNPGEKLKVFISNGTRIPLVSLISTHGITLMELDNLSRLGVIQNVTSSSLTMGVQFVMTTLGYNFYCAVSTI